MTSRTRQTGSLSNATWNVQDTNGPLGIPPNQVYPPTNYVTASKSQGNLDTCIDVNVPDFKKLQSEGQVIMNPLSIVKTVRETSQTDMTLGTLPQWGKRRFWGECACVWSVPPTYPSWYATRITDHKYDTITRAHAKVAELDFMAYVSVAEAGKTAKMLASPMSGARKLIEQIYKRQRSLLDNRYRNLSPVAAAAKAWNEYRFGWKPLLYDIQGIMDSYVTSGAISPRPQRFTARASGIVEHSPVEVYSPLVTGTTKVTMIRDVTRYARISSGVLYEISEDNTVDQRLRSMGLRLSDVPASIWELVPWSFVADRFVTVGNWLQAIVPKPGVKHLGSWTTVVDVEEIRHEIVDVLIHVNEPVGPGTDLRGRGGSYHEKNFSYTRTINPSIPIAPTYNPRELGVQQHVDHVSLLVDQIFKLGLPKRASNPF